MEDYGSNVLKWKAISVLEDGAWVEIDERSSSLKKYHDFHDPLRCPGRLSSERACMHVCTRIC